MSGQVGTSSANLAVSPCYVFNERRKASQQQNICVDDISDTEVYCRCINDFTLVARRVQVSAAEERCNMGCSDTRLLKYSVVITSNSM